jgi:thiaminase
MAYNINHNLSTYMDTIQSDLFDTVNVISNHQYIEALDNKKINKEKLEIFVCEQYHIIANDKRNFAFMVSKTSNNTASMMFIDCLYAELNGLENLTHMAEELGIDKRKIESYEPLAGCQAYTNYLTRLAVYGSDAEIFAALLIDLPVWGANCMEGSNQHHDVRPSTHIDLNCCWSRMFALLQELVSIEKQMLYLFFILFI